MRFASKFKPELCASKDETRPQLCHVEYDVASQRLLATDGHRLIAVPCHSEEGDVTGPVTAEALAAARKVDKKRSDMARIRANGVQATGELLDGPTFQRPVRDEHSAFPPVDKVVPSWKPGDAGTVTFGVDAKYLYELALALGADNCKGRPHIHITVKLPDPELNLGVRDPLLVTTSDTGDGAVGVCMPVRVS